MHEFLSTRSRRLTWCIPGCNSNNFRYFKQMFTSHRYHRISQIIIDNPCVVGHKSLFILLPSGPWSQPMPVTPTSGFSTQSSLPGALGSYPAPLLVNGWSGWWTLMDYWPCSETHLNMAYELECTSYHMQPWKDDWHMSQTPKKIKKAGLQAQDHLLPISNFCLVKQTRGT